MSVYRRGGKWGIGYSLNGKWVRRIVGPSKKMAEQLERKTKLDIDAGKFFGIASPKPVIFEKLCDEYLQFSQANKTAHSHRRDITNIKSLSKIFAERLISEIKAQDVEKYKAMRKDEVAPATVNREISCIKHMFTKAVHWGYLAENSLRSVMKFKEPPGRTRYLNDDEIKRLLYCCPQHIKAIVITALNTGMRKSEILNLRWPDVDLVKRLIKVRDSKNHQSRHIRINDVLYAALIKLSHDSAYDSVFLGKHGKPIKSIQNAWERALRNADIKDFRFHDLRHTFASHLAMHGVNIRDIQDLLGQKTILMTMRYSHISNEVLHKAVDMLNLGEYNDREDRTNTAQSGSVKKCVSVKRCKH